MGTSKLILDNLAKSHDGDVTLLGMFTHGGGLLVMFTVRYGCKLEARTAYMELRGNGQWIICKWDNICG